MSTFIWYLAGVLTSAGLTWCYVLLKQPAKEHAEFEVTEKMYSVVWTRIGWVLCRSVDLYFLDGNEKTVLLRATTTDGRSFTTCDPEIFDFDDISEAMKFIDAHNE